MLTADDVDIAAVASTVEKASNAPVSVHGLGALRPDRALAEALEARPGDVWLIRPDAHVAAIVPADDVQGLQDAVQRSSVPPSPPRPPSDRQGESDMPFYRTAGEIPRKRHTQFRKDDGTLYHEELMGEEGFSDDSSLLYHRQLAHGHRRQPRPSTARPRRRPTCRCVRGTSAPTSSTAAAPTPVTGRRPCSATPMSASRTPPPTGRRRCTATPSATSACTSSPAPGRSSRSSGPSRSAAATTS